jgi:hypothetical protein
LTWAVGVADGVHSNCCPSTRITWNRWYSVLRCASAYEPRLPRRPSAGTGARLFDIHRLIEYDAISCSPSLALPPASPHAAADSAGRGAAYSHHTGDHHRGRAKGVMADWPVLGIRECAELPRASAMAARHPCPSARTQQARCLNSALRCPRAVVAHRVWSV